MLGLGAIGEFTIGRMPFGVPRVPTPTPTPTPTPPAVQAVSGEVGIIEFNFDGGQSGNVPTSNLAAHVSIRIV